MKKPNSSNESLNLHKNLKMVPQSAKFSMTSFYGIYFVVAALEIVAEYFSYKSAIIVLKPMLPVLLIFFYWMLSPSRNMLFIAAMLFSMLTNLLFIATSEKLLFLGIVAFLFHRVFAIRLIVNLLKIKDYIPAVIATIPILLFFCYLLSITPNIAETAFWLLIVQNILIAILGGISISSYLMDDTKRNSWLLICGILFTALQFIVFIERYYLSGISPVIFRPIAMFLNALAFFTFYRFVLTTELSNGDAAPV